MTELPARPYAVPARAKIFLAAVIAAIRADYAAADGHLSSSEDWAVYDLLDALDDAEAKFKMRLAAIEDGEG
jgi:hypothetical protein